jgi:acetyl esterase/lipase
MDIIRRMYPELADALAQIPSIVLSEETLPVLRAEVAQMREFDKAALPDVPDVVTENRTVSGVEGNPDVSIRVYHPAGTSAVLPALLWIHGGCDGQRGWGVPLAVNQSV